MRGEERGWKPKRSTAQSPPLYLLLFTITLHNFTFWLAAHGAEERRTTACRQNSYYHSKQIFLSSNWPTALTWPANNCLQIMVCPCAMPSNCVWLQIIFCRCVKETVLFSFLRPLLHENGRLLRFPRIFIKKSKLGDRMIKQLLNLVIAKYHDLSVSRRSIICLSLQLWQIIDLLTTDKSRYFSQPHPIIVNYWSLEQI